MNILSLATLSFGMSMDAFAVAIAKGATGKNPSFLTALKGGIFFGAIEAAAPVVGFVLGSVAERWLASFDHWIAFALLGFLGVRFLMEAFAGEHTADEPQAKTGVLILITTAIATSIDSMVVGVSLAFLQVNIFVASALIGVATTVMATLGLYLGHRLGRRFGRLAMGFGGVMLMLIGVVILYTHLIG